MAQGAVLTAGRPFFYVVASSSRSDWVHIAVRELITLVIRPPSAPPVCEKFCVPSMLNAHPVQARDRHWRVASAP